jgi:hypothetical protein
MKTVSADRLRNSTDGMFAYNGIMKTSIPVAKSLKSFECGRMYICLRIDNPGSGLYICKRNVVNYVFYLEFSRVYTKHPFAD